MFSQNFNIIEVAARELHLPKVEGVEGAFFFPNPVIIAFCFEA
jgi:hypothetical protein